MSSFVRIGGKSSVAFSDVTAPCQCGLLVGNASMSYSHVDYNGVPMMHRLLNMCPRSEPK